MTEIQIIEGYGSFSNSTNMDRLKCNTLPAICNVLPRVTVKFIIHIYMDIYINIYFKKIMVTPSNASQIAQNQVNLRENIW